MFYNSMDPEDRLNEKNNRIVILECFIFWFAACVIFHFFQYRGGIIISVLLLGMYFYLEPKYRFVFIFSGLPFQAINKMASSVPSTICLLYALFIFEFYKKNKFNIKRKDGICLIFVLFLQTVAILIYDASISSVVAVFLSIIFAKVSMDSMITYNKPKELYLTCAWVYIASMVIDILCSQYLFPEMPYVILLEKQLLLDRDHRFAALNGDPNYYGQLVIIAICFLIVCLYYYFKRKQYSVVVICLGLITFFTLKGIDSYSKGYAVSLSAVIVLALYYLITNDKKSIHRVLSTLVFFFVGAITTYFTYRYIVIPIIDSRVNTDLFTGRLTIWAGYWRLFSLKPMIPVFGCGIANGELVIKNVLGHKVAAHNIYIEVICDLGIVGFISIITYWSDVIHVVKHIFSRITLLFIWAFLITSASLSASANDVLFFMIPLIGLSFDINKDQ